MADAVKHTPGPWVAMFDSRRENYQIYAGERAGQRAWLATTKCESVSANHKANALLIAASPDMLAALLELDASEAEYEGNVEDDERCRQALKLVRAAIAKATGDS